MSNQFSQLRIQNFDDLNRFFNNNTGSVRSFGAARRVVRVLAMQSAGPAIFTAFSFFTISLAFMSIDRFFDDCFFAGDDKKLGSSRFFRFESFLASLKMRFGVIIKLFDSFFVVNKCDSEFSLETGVFNLFGRFFEWTVWFFDSSLIDALSAGDFSIGDISAIPLKLDDLDLKFGVDDCCCSVAFDDDGDFELNAVAGGDFLLPIESLGIGKKPLLFTRRGTMLAWL